jgi:DNA-binding NarL/FixJ family response regulator
MLIEEFTRFIRLNDQRMKPPPRRTVAFSHRPLEANAKWPKLTVRETAVLKGVATGDSNRTIGLQLGIGEQTVKNHVSVLIQKFQVRNRVQLAVTVALEMPELFRRVG